MIRRRRNVLATPAYPRTLGLLTFCYGAYTAARPGSLIHASELESRAAPPSRTGRALGILVGARDVISGAAMMLTPPGRARQTAVAARVACDLTDVVAFGLAVPSTARAKVMSVAAGWGLLCATSYPAARGRM